MITFFKSLSKNMKITLSILGILTVLFVIFALQILLMGLGYTDMDNNFAFGAWIIGDLVLVALGGGAFSTGFVLYIFRVEKLRPLINSTVLIGFMCYLFTFVFLLFDLGQPLRAWFGFAYPNWGKGVYPVSMLTEVFFCLSIYFIILLVELIPTVLEHKVLIQNRYIKTTAHIMHDFMWIMAAAGTFLSFFHQGSLGGGMWGVLFGKAVWYRPHFFFLAVVAAIAGGMSFMTMVPYVAGKILKKELVPMESFRTLTRMSGFMFIAYAVFRGYDLYSMAAYYVPMSGRSFLDLYGGYYGIWMVVVEIILLTGPLVLLNMGRFRNQEKLMITGASMGIGAIIMSKFSVLLHGFSAPNFPWKGFTSYFPTYQEWFITFGVLALMILIYMTFIKWFPLFPHTEEGGGHH